MSLFSIILFIIQAEHDADEESTEHVRGARTRERRLSKCWCYDVVGYIDIYVYLQLSMVTRDCVLAIRHRLMDKWMR